jgi:hypothetical protein
MVYSFIQDEARNDQVTIPADTSTVVSFARTEANPRKVLLIRNITKDVTGNEVDIFVNFGLKRAEYSKGIVLKAGESFSDSSEAGYKCFQGTITAICESVTGYLSVLER